MYCVVVLCLVVGNGIPGCEEGAKYHLKGVTGCKKVCTRACFKTPVNGCEDSNISLKMFFTE